MSRRIVSLLLSIALVLGLTTGIAYAVPTPEVYSKTTVGDTQSLGDKEQDWCFVNEIFSIHFYIKNAQDFMSITLPLLYDPATAALLDKDGNELEAGTDKRDIMIVNPVLEPMSNANYPEFDLKNGFIRSMLISVADAGAVLDGEDTLLCTLNFRAKKTGFFDYTIATDKDDHYDETTPMGIVFYGTSESDPLWGVTPEPYHIIPDLQEFEIINEKSPPPEYVYINTLFDDIVAVGGLTPGAAVTLYDDDGNIIGSGVANEDGLFAMIGVDCSNGVNATQTEPYKLESDPTPGEEKEYGKVLAIIEPNDIIVVPYGTTAADAIAMLPEKVRGRIGIEIDLPGQSSGIYVFDDIVELEKDGDWASGATPVYNGNVSGLYQFYVSPITDKDVRNKYDLQAKQPVYVLPENVGPNEYIVIFVNDEDIYETQIVEGGDVAVRPADDPTRTGGFFNGWYIKKADGTLELFDFETKIYNHTIIRAVFDPAYTVTFVDHDGTVLDVDTVKYGEAATAPDDPEREGYEFIGWDKEYDYITGDLTVTAQYVPKGLTEKHTVTGKLIGGSVGNKTISYTINDTPGTVTTDASGNYAIPDVPHGARVVITPPVQSGYNVSPGSRTLDSVETDVTDQDFTYTPRGGTTTPDPDPDPDPDPTPTPTPDPDLGNDPVIPALNKGDHHRYIIGYPDGTVQPEGYITREEVAAIFYRLLTQETRKYYRQATASYPDVQDARWSAMSIGTMENMKIVTGYPDGNFGPGDPITRAQLATIAMRFDNLEKGLPHNFSDISGHWAEDYISSAVQKGWVLGYPDGTFKPDQPITRVEAMTLINRVLDRNVDAAGLPAELVLNWPDLPKDHWGYYEVEEATVSHHYVRRSADSIVENWTSKREDINFDVD